MNRNDVLENGRKAMLQLRFQEAIDLADRVLRSDSSDVPALYLKAQALGNLDRFPESLDLLNRILGAVSRESSMYWETLITKGNLLLDMNDVDAAEACFDEAIAIVPRLARAWIEKGRVAARRKDFVRSLDYCSRAVSLDSSDPRAWNNTAFAHLQLNRLDECIEAARKAVELKPDYPMAWMWMAQACEKKGDAERAREYFNRAQGHLQTPSIHETVAHKPAPPEPPKKRRWWQ